MLPKLFQTALSLSVLRCRAAVRALSVSLQRRTKRVPGTGLALQGPVVGSSPRLLPRFAFSRMCSSASNIKSANLSSESEKKWSENKAEDAIKLMQEAIEQNDTNSLLHAKLADMLYLSGQHRSAIESYTTSLRLNPDSPSVRAARAEAYLALGNVDEAESDLVKSTKVNRTYTPAFVRLAYLYLDKTNSPSQKERSDPRVVNLIEKAVQLFSKAIALDNKQVAALYGRGLAFSRMSKFEDAIKDYDACLAVDEKYSPAIHGLAGCYHLLQSYNQAVAYYSLFLKTHRQYYEEEIKQQNSPTARDFDGDKMLSDVLLKRAICFFHTGQPELAEIDLDALLSMNKHFKDMAFYWLAKCAAKQNKWEKVVSHCSRALAINPHLAEAYQQRAAANEALGLPDLAKEDSIRFHHTKREAYYDSLKYNNRAAEPTSSSTSPV